RWGRHPRDDRGAAAGRARRRCSRARRDGGAEAARPSCLGSGPDRAPAAPPDRRIPGPGARHVPARRLEPHRSGRVGRAPRRRAQMSIREDRKGSLTEDRGRVPPRQLAHVVRRTARFEELVRWYCTVLGAEVVHSDGMLAFLTYDDEHHRLAVVSIPGLDEQPAMAAGTDHIAFTYPHLGDLPYTYTPLSPP